MATNTASGSISGQPSKRDPNAFPLDEKMFKLLREQDLDLVKLYTGIQDHEQVKAHIINIQKEAYPVWLDKLRSLHIYLHRPHFSRSCPTNAFGSFLSLRTCSDFVIDMLQGLSQSL